MGSDKFEDMALKRRPVSLTMLEIGLVAIPVLALVLFFFCFMAPQLNKTRQQEWDLLEKRERIDSVCFARRSQTLSQDSSEMVRNLAYRIETLENNNEILINDVRQEVNNNIDKANMWLTFWLAIIALFGGFIPILIQYRLYIINREKLLQEMTFYRDFVRANSLHNIAGNFIIVSRSQIALDSMIRTSLMQRFINNATDIFSEIVASISKKYNGILTPDVLSLMLQALLQIYLITDEIGKHITRSRRREYHQISDAIKVTLKDLGTVGSNNSIVRMEDLIMKLHDLSSKLSGLIRCLN